MNRSRRFLTAFTALMAVFLFSADLPPAGTLAATQRHVSPSPSLDEALLPPEFPANLPRVPRISVKLHDTAAAQALDGVFGLSLLRENRQTGVATLHVPEFVDVDDAVRQLQQHPLVEWAEPVRWRRLIGVPQEPINPNDSNYASQKWYYDLMSMPGGWGIETGRPGVTIAVLDSGVLCTHPDLAANIWKNTKEIPGNGIDDDGNGYVDDVNGFDFVGAETGNPNTPSPPNDSDPCVKAGDPSVGNGLDDDGNGERDGGVSHGTMVAGIAAAVTNNSQGVAGACWGCTIMVVRVANPEGSLESSDVADGITYAAQNGAKVINLSLGGDKISLAERAAVDLAVNSGVVVVAASGNDNHSPISFPAQLANVIAVGSSARTNPKGRANFSNWGTGGANDRPVDVVAPGVDIASTAVTSKAEEATGQGTAGSPRYLRGSGTSFSAPLVAGLVGLMLSRNSTLTPADIKARLKAAASPLPDDPTDSPNAGPLWAGAGMVNAQLTLENITASATPTPTAIGSVTPGPSPTGTVTPTGSPTGTPVPGGTKPQTQSPAKGTTLTGLGTTLTWVNPAGATQFQVQVVPAKNDGPAINLIRNVESSYVVQPPVFGSGPYVMLPELTYTWRVRTTAATTGIDENSPLWGPWSDDSTFKTRTAVSTGIAALQPADTATAIALTPALQWSNPDADIFYYEVQLSKDRTFNADPQTATAMVYWNLVHGAIPTPPNSYTVPASFPLEANTRYFWRIRPRVQGDGVPVPWSTLFSFTTG